MYAVILRGTKVGVSLSQDTRRKAVCDAQCVVSHNTQMKENSDKRDEKTRDLRVMMRVGNRFSSVT